MVCFIRTGFIETHIIDDDVLRASRILMFFYDGLCCSDGCLLLFLGGSYVMFFVLEREEAVIARSVGLAQT